MARFWADARASFQSWWAQFGILISAVGIFSFIARVLQISLTDTLRVILAGFRFVFHPIIEFVFGWLPLELTPLMKDGAVVWLAIGGAVARTFYSVIHHARTPKQGPDASNDDGYLLLKPHWLSNVVKGRVTSVLFLPVAMVCWPLVALLMASFPILWWPNSGRIQNDRGDFKSVFDDNDPAYICDLRVVMMLQLLAISLCVAGLTLLNAMTLGIPKP